MSIAGTRSAVGGPTFNAGVDGAVLGRAELAGRPEVA
jgi:hypothetical protein